MMRTRREWNRMIDAHVQGLNDPNAPFNQTDWMPPMCDECDVDPCDEACDKVKAIWEEQAKKEEEMDEAMYDQMTKDLREMEEEDAKL